MGFDGNLYSIEAISEALLEAGSLAARSRDEAEIIRGHLLPLADLLQMNCGTFYASASSPLASISPVHATAPGRRQLVAPDSIPAEMEEYVTNAIQQVATSHDPVFAMGHLRNLAAFGAATSLWTPVDARHVRFGTLALFDQSAREFRRVEMQLVRTFALQLGQTLESLHAQKPAEPRGGELERYMESSKLIGSVSRDLINPLTAMLGYIELMKSENLDERSRHFLLKLQEQTEKTQQIVLALNLSGTHGPLPGARTILPRMAMMPPLPAESGDALRPPLVMSRRSKVLVVQKSEPLLEFQKSILAALSTEVFSAANGKDAIDLMRDQEMNAVLLDDELDGEWQGGKLFGWIQKNQPELSEHVLFTISARPRDEIRDLMEESGVTHISKPLQMVELFSGIQQVLGQTKESRFLH